MKKNDIIDLSKENICPKCNKSLKFEWEGINSNNKIATCCNKEYWTTPSDTYIITAIKDENNDIDDLDEKSDLNTNKNKEYLDSECSTSTTYEKLENFKKTKTNYWIQKSEIDALDYLINYGSAKVEGDETAINLIKGLRQMNIRFKVISVSEFNKNWYFEIIKC